VQEVRSLTRRIVLTTPPPAPWAWRLLLVPDGATDAQVLAWAADLLDPASVAELRARIEADCR